MVSVKQIYYALAVEKTRHFKNAADACNVSQSALSSAIAEMESQLGLKIFERDNKRVLVTPIGQQVLDKARSIHQQVDELHKLSDSLKQPLSYPMSVGVIPTIGPYLLPKVLPTVRREYPDFKLSIVEEQSQLLVEKVRSGEIDTAIIALPYDTDGLHAFEFWQEDFFWVMHKDDEAQIMQQIAENHLENLNLLLLKEGHCLKDHALSACNLRDAQQDGLAGTSLYTLIQMVACRMGATLVPQMALDQLMSDNSELTAHALQERGPHRRIAFVTRLNYPAVANIEILMKLFKKRLQSCPLPPLS